MTSIEFLAYNIIRSHHSDELLILGYGSHRIVLDCRTLTTMCSSTLRNVTYSNDESHNRRVVLQECSDLTSEHELNRMSGVRYKGWPVCGSNTAKWIRFSWPPSTVNQTQWLTQLNAIYRVHTGI